MTTKRDYPGIDFFKLIAACLVVLLHTVETTAWYPSEIKYVFTRLAVPFFFITSGFFFYKGLDCSENPREYLIKYEKNLLRIFSIWALLIYSPFTIGAYVGKYANANPLMLIGTLFRRIFVIGPGPYWYLIALMWSALFLYFCYRKGANWLLSFGIVFGLILEVLYSCCQGVLAQFTIFRLFFKLVYGVFSWEYNFLMFGIPFMGIGYLISQKEWELSTGKAAVLLLLATVLSALEYNLPLIFPSAFWEKNHITFAFILQGVSYFMLAKSLKVRFETEVALNCRQLSAFIYFLHTIVLYNILNPLMDRYTNFATYSGTMIAPKVLVVLAVCAACFWAIKKANNKYLNLLLNG